RRLRRVRPGDGGRAPHGGARAPLPHLRQPSITAAAMGVLLVNAVVVVAVMVGLWGVSTRNHDPSFVDVWWGLGFVLEATLTASLTHGAPARQATLLMLTALWGCRLAGYLFW